MDQTDDIRILRVDLPGGRVACVAVAVWPVERPDQVAAPSDAEVSLAGDALKKLFFTETNSTPVQRA